MVTQAARLAPRQRELGRAMRAAEARALALVRDIPEARAVLSARPAGQRKYVKVDALEAAVGAVWAASQEQHALREVARQSRAAWAEAVAHRNALALTAQGLADAVASKLAPTHLVEDAKQEARIGLIEAAKRYDPEAPNTFTTYATWWVRARLTRSLEREAPLSVASGARQTLWLIKRLRAQREWTESELAEELGIDLWRLREILSADVAASSLDDPLPGGETKLHEVIADDEAPGEDELVEGVDRDVRWAEVQAAIATLPKREARIIEARWGLGGQRARTLDEVGKTLGLSRERTRQLELRAMQALRDELGLALPPRAQARDVRSRLLVALRTMGCARSKELARALRLPPRVVNASIQSAVQAGLVRRVAHATYAIAEAQTGREGGASDASPGGVATPAPGTPQEPDPAADLPVVIEYSVERA